MACWAGSAYRTDHCVADPDAHSPGTVSWVGTRNLASPGSVLKLTPLPQSVHIADFTDAWPDRDRCTRRNLLRRYPFASSTVSNLGTF
jgi:hypothetical protein